MIVKNIQMLLQDVSFAKINWKNINLKKYVIVVIMDILKQKKINVFIVNQNNMEEEIA